LWVCFKKMTQEIKMKTLKTTTSKLVLLAGLASASALMSIGVDVFAQDQVQAQVQIYGSQLMTAAERTEYQSKMRTLKTDKERDAFRLDHHDKMKVRAAEKGVTLPNSPPAAGTAAGRSCPAGGSPSARSRSGAGGRAGGPGQRG
jgi:hypothetical protein